MAVPQWNPAFGCVVREAAQLRSLLRTHLSGSLPAPFLSRKGDTSAPVEFDIGLDMDDATFHAWEQWFSYDLFDGALPFTIFLPWGTEQPKVRVRFIAAWQAQRLEGARWSVSATLEIERESLPLFSGGVR